MVDPHARDHVTPGGLFVMDRTLGWRLKPDTTVTHQNRYFDVTYTSNAWGYRDQSRTSSRGPRRNRVLVFGDSQVFGWGIPETLRFSNLLEAEHPTLEVWNLGVPGYGLDQQLLAYEQDAPGWAADTVVFFISHTTLERMKATKSFQKYKPRFVLDSPGTLQLIPPPVGEVQWTALLYRVLSPWYLPYFLERRLAMLTEGPRPERSGAAKAVSDPSLDRLMEAVLERAARVAQERRHQLILLADLPPTRREALLNVCVPRGIRAVVVELPGPREDFIHGREDPHWNRRGHRWIAEEFWRQWKGQDHATPRG